MGARHGNLAVCYGKSEAHNQVNINNMLGENPTQVSPNLGKVVIFTNIDDQDFEHAYNGQPFRVPAGESQHMPFDLADHLATHLARKILIRGDGGKNIYDPTDKSGGSGIKIFGPEEERKLKDKILGNTYQVERDKPETEVERLQREVSELNKFVKDNVPGLKAVEPSIATTGDTYETKADVIAKLTSLGIKFDSRQTKDKLIEHLNNSLKENV